MYRFSLFRKDIEPRCAYCVRAKTLDENTATCMKRGVVELTGYCKSFKYDPISRIPSKPPTIRGEFSAADFALVTSDEK